MDTNIEQFYKESVFWTHVLVIFGSVLVSFFLSAYCAAGILFLHRIHVFVFGECLLSKAQRKAGGLPDNVNFLQFAVKKFFQKEITTEQSRFLDYAIVGFAFTAALIKYL